MKLWRVTLPLALLILFELAVGILLFVEPEGFTTGIIVGFGLDGYRLAIEGLKGMA